MNLLTTLYISIILATSTAFAEDHNKRAPSGFTGVRGKKSISDSAYDSIIEDTEGSETLLKPDYSVTVSDGDSVVARKRAPSGFMGMRGKKPFTYVQPLEGTYPDVLYKRAPSGFMGMRGKKDNEFAGYDEKRAPSGFMGMRGKKENSYLDFKPNSYYSDKRALMGFLGMRGKKSIEDSLLPDDKSTPSGFFDMRGKKHPSGFFGVRGKKYPHEFRGKFVGVRGKKMSNEITGPDHYKNLNLDLLGKELNINQLMLILTEQEEGDREWNERSNGQIRQ